MAWINEQRMKIWQVDLFHRVTEENGINATRSTTYERGGSLRDRSSIRPREVLDPSPDYTPEKNIPTRARPHSDNQYREATVSVSCLFEKKSLTLSIFTFANIRFNRLFTEQHPGFSEQVPAFATCSYNQATGSNDETTGQLHIISIILNYKEFSDLKLRNCLLEIRRSTHFIFKSKSSTS